MASSETAYSFYESIVPAYETPYVYPVPDRQFNCVTHRTPLNVAHMGMTCTLTDVLPNGTRIVYAVLDISTNTSIVSPLSHMHNSEVNQTDRFSVVPHSHPSSRGRQFFRLIVSAVMYLMVSILYFIHWSMKYMQEKIPIYCFAATASSNQEEMYGVFDTDSYPIVVDTGCSRTVSAYIDDFVADTLRIPSGEPSKLRGIAGASAPITKIGTIKWSILDDNGVQHDILLPNSLYVPTLNARLLSPQHLAQTSDTNVQCSLSADELTIHWDNGRFHKTASITTEGSNVATIWAAPGYKCFAAFQAIMTRPKTTTAEGDKSPSSNIVEQSNIQPPTEDDDIEDLPVGSILDKGSVIESADELRTAAIDFPLATEGDQNKYVNVSMMDTYLNDKSPSELKLIWHVRLGHVSMNRIDRLAELGYLPKSLLSCSHPICQACVYGKLTRRPWRTKAKTNDVVANHSTDTTFPGQVISVDQLESTIPGFIGQAKGKLTKQRYHVATVFVDHFSQLSYVYLQQSTTSKETLLAKEAFEAYAETFGVKIKHYRADNGRFADNMWRDDVHKKGQGLTFSGVGAHHQNGRAEKRIRDLQDLARTSIIHANSRWPDAINTNLWPYALRYANDSLNQTPFPEQTKTPIEIFSRTENCPPDVKLSHPFGCPAYALDASIQGGMKGRKWGNRARLAIYLGRSPQHAGTVGLLLSLTSGLVSAQFHVKYDDLFQTVASNQLYIRSNWQQQAGFLNNKQKRSDRKSKKIQPQIPLSENLDQFDVNDVFDHQTLETPTVSDHPIDGNEAEELMVVDEPMDESSTASSDDSDQEPTTTTRSGRKVINPSRYRDFIGYSVDIIPVDAWDAMVASNAFAASTDPDVMYLDEALKAKDAAEFIKAMNKEVKSHVENKNWVVVDRDKIPPGKSVVPAVWAMRRKRDIATREVYKWKARLNYHGGKQTKGVDYWETYAPVASWSSIRVVMLIAVFNCWYTKQLDFVLAFPQAPVETELYMAIPPGFTVSGDPKSKALKLINNLYGQKQAGRVWNRYLTQGLKKLMFIQSASDDCIFYRGNVIIVIYTDDTIVTGKCEKEVDQAILDIKSMFEITHQDKVDDFLGVKIQRNKQTNSVTLTQPQLIQSILEDLKLDASSNVRKVPALSSVVMHKYESSPEHNESWSYRSVIGKLNYLSKSTRPDIEYAVHQCARFSESPREEHTKAVKLIGRYLLGTKDKGLIYQPTFDSVKCYADADFAGAWEHSVAMDDANTARSRSGYIILYAGCPIIWASRLQTEIALSSTESEYISLSQSLREVIPLMRIIKELKQAGFDLPDKTPEVHCTLFEDNNGALAMASNHKMRPRTKHLNIKYHHFWEHVTTNQITIEPIDTFDQLADILTKPLGVSLFERFRQFIMGW